MRMSMMRPLTSSIQINGLSSIRLGSVHSGSNLRILSRSRIAIDLADPVASETPNPSSMSVIFMLRLGGVAEEVHPADGPHDPAGPGLGLASGQRGRPLAGQDARHLPAQ